MMSRGCAVAALISMLMLWPDGRGPVVMSQTPTSSAPLFVESAASVGLTFTHENGASGRYYIAEEMGAGAALFDFDNDGDLDAFLVQGGPLGAEVALPPVARPTSRLFRNDLTKSND
jgi:hypothetical protein